MYALVWSARRSRRSRALPVRGCGRVPHGGWFTRFKKIITAFVVLFRQGNAVCGPSGRSPLATTTAAAAAARTGCAVVGVPGAIVLGHAVQALAVVHVHAQSGVAACLDEGVVVPVGGSIDPPSAQDDGVDRRQTTDDRRQTTDDRRQTMYARDTQTAALETCVGVVNAKLPLSARESKCVLRECPQRSVSTKIGPADGRATDDQSVTQTPKQKRSDERRIRQRTHSSDTS
jgi:hypothetical protein